MRVVSIAYMTNQRAANCHRYQLYGCDQSSQTLMRSQIRDREPGLTVTIVTTIGQRCH